MAGNTATTIDTGDHVKHGPTGEGWVVAYVKGDRLAWVGWPEGEALLADCKLITKVTDVERDALLRALAKSKDGPRKSYAVARLAIAPKP